MHLQEALSQITEIRAQISRTETFRGYRSATMMFSGSLAILAGIAQTIWIPQPMQDVYAYLTLWVGVAAVTLMVTGAEMTWRCIRSASPWTKRLTMLAVEQFLPCVVVGAMITVLFTAFAPQQVWMLPGLWAMTYSLGAFASCRFLPRPCFLIGVFYMLAGAVCFGLARGEAALSPWAMVGTFGVGQFLVAAILYFTLERKHD